MGPSEPLWELMNDRERGGMEAFIREHFPSMHLELERLKSRRPQRFARRMSRIAPEIRRVMDLMQSDPERAALLIQSRRLDMQLRMVAGMWHRATGDQERITLEKRLRELCAESFDCRQRRRAVEIRELEARIAELKHRHEETALTRERMIDQMMKDYLDSPAPPPIDDEPR